MILLSAVVNLGLKGISNKINFPTKAYHIMAHQVICLSLQKNGVNVLEAWDILSKANCFSGITFQKFTMMINFMLEHEYLRKVDELLVVGEECEKKYLGANWRKLFAVFDGSPMYDVWEEKKHIGTLDAAFVDALNIPFLFVLGGIEWEAYKIKPESREIFARKTKIGDAPKWVVYGGQQVPYETAKEAGKILFGNEKINFLNDEAEACILSLREKIKSINWTDQNWVINLLNKNKVEIWTFAGDRINKTLSKLLTISGIGLATSSYQKVEVRKKEDNELKLDTLIHEFLNKLKLMDRQTFYLFEKQLLEEIKLAKFSKFTMLLHEELWHETVAEQTFDMEGLVAEIKNENILII
ncbi:MAG: hypothetical protein PVH88_04165 [Ignavibacteria bacterium]